MKRTITKYCGWGLWFFFWVSKPFWPPLKFVWNFLTLFFTQTFHPLWKALILRISCFVEEINQTISFVYCLSTLKQNTHSPKLFDLYHHAIVKVTNHKLNILPHSVFVNLCHPTKSICSTQTLLVHLKSTFF